MSTLVTRTFDLLTGFSAIAALAIFAVVVPVMPARGDTQLTVFAAASLKNALDDVVAVYETQEDASVSLSYAGSSSLARQIQNGAPAQIFVSANTQWMDAIEQLGLLAPGTRVDLARNTLVLIAGSLAAGDAPILPEVGPDTDLSAALQGGRLAMALVDAVPAGIYGREALMSLGHWSSVKAHVAQTDNVRAALRLVALGEAPLGIVYATDVAADPRVRVLGVFPASTHPEIVYAAARLTDGETAASVAFFRFLTGAEAGAIFERHGFGTIKRPGQ